ncbi:MAG: hypothetical protein PVF68_17285 [Acidobacteriota bacterium]|jgi:pimeloyl-ACP methyl ester carboxylesterase
MPEKITPPYYPIIYVRGYAGSETAVEDTVATPYMGFNLGSTKLRQRWTGEIQRFYFESPLVRLMKLQNHPYRDVYHEGDPLVELPGFGPDDPDVPAQPGPPISPRSIIIYRYYEPISEDLGEEDRPDLPFYARGLGRLIVRVRDQICQGDPESLAAFKVYLVAHSMGGLICRCFLQHPPEGTPPTQQYVDKVFTYATPHNGIEMKVIGNVPGFITKNNQHNFNRKYMAKYLGLSPDSKRVDSLNGKFDPDRFFCLVGTNHKDYEVAGGWSRRMVGPMSDGLVRIDNASVQGAPRAFVHRSHSGDYGIVNSEEGYQNLSRFLFGDMRVDGILRIKEITLPPEIFEAVTKKKKKLRASYHFETVVRPRDARYDLSRRVVDEGSAVFRKYDELFHPGKVGLDQPREPVLFSTFLRIANRSRRAGALVFSVDLRILVPEYELDGRIFDHHIEGSYLFRDVIHIAAESPEISKGDWVVRYGFDSSTPGRPGQRLAVRKVGAADTRFEIPIVNKTRPGIDAILELVARPWNQPGGGA